MAAFNYIALTAAGKQQKGVAEADTERQVRQQLRAKGLVPLQVIPVNERSKRHKRTRKIPHTDLALLTRQMATLLGAGMPLDEVLSGVAQQTQKTFIRSILLGVRAKVLEGYSLAASLAEFPQSFPMLYRTTISAGERSGKLDHVLLRLATYTEKQYRIRAKVKQAMIYPSMMTAVSIAIVVFLLIYVVPKIIHVFAQTKEVLPLETIVLVGISHFIQHYGIYLLALLVLVAMGINVLLKQHHIRAVYHRWVLRLPVIGKTVRTVNCARFARTFGILNAATVPVLEGMKAASLLVVPIPMQVALCRAIERVREGAPIHESLKRTGYFPPLMLHLIASGEQSGQLDAMLEKAADNQEQDVEMLIQNALTLFEPILILIMGAVVLFIVLAVMLPIFTLDQYGG